MEGMRERCRERLTLELIVIALRNPVKGVRLGDDCWMKVDRQHYSSPRASSAVSLLDAFIPALLGSEFRPAKEPVTRAPAKVDPHIAADAPARLLQSLQECREASLSFHIVCSEVHENA